MLLLDRYYRLDLALRALRKCRVVHERWPGRKRQGRPLPPERACESFEIIKKISFEIPGLRPEAIQPVGVRITREGKKAFVALGPANRVAVIDAVTFEVEGYLLVGQRVWQLAFTPDEKLLISTNGVSNDISIIDTGQRKVLKSIQVGQLPWGVAVSPQ